MTDCREEDLIEQLLAVIDKGVEEYEMNAQHLIEHLIFGLSERVDLQLLLDIIYNTDNDINIGATLH